MRRKISVLIAFVVCLAALVVVTSACVSANSNDDPVVSVTINNIPSSAATVYQGDGLSLEECSVAVIYQSGKRDVLNLAAAGVAVTGFSPNQVGLQTLTVSYGGKSVNFEVEVLPLAVEEVYISARPDEITVVEGGELDISGIELTIRYVNGRTVLMESITADMITGYSTSMKAGEYVVYVNYYGFKLPLDIVVQTKSLTSVSVATTPNKVSYFVGDVIELEGLSLKLNYDNGTTGTVVWSVENGDDFTIEYDFGSENGKSNVAVTYGGKYTSFVVNVVKPTCERVEIYRLPVTVGFASTGVAPSDLMQVVQGDKIDWSTGRARVIYNNGDVEEYTLDSGSFYLYINGTSPADYVPDKTNYKFEDVGEISAYIRYSSNSFLNLISVNVVAKSAYSMTVADINPSFADRIEEKIFSSGTSVSGGFLKYNVKYNNETWKYPDADIPGETWGALGEGMLADGSELTFKYNAALETGNGYSLQTVTFTEDGVSASFTVKVARPSAMKLEVRFPYKTAYLAGTDKELDLTGTSMYAELNTAGQFIVRYDVLTHDFIGEYGVYYKVNDDGSTGEETVNIFNTLGKYRLVIEYYGLQASFDFSVVDASEYVGSLDVYYIATGANIDSGETLTVTDYASLVSAYELRAVIGGVESYLPLDSDEVTLLSGITTLTGTAQNFTFGYRGAYVGVRVMLTGRQIASVSVSSAPAKSVYAPGEAFDGRGLKLTKVYGDGTKEQISYPNAAVSFGVIPEGAEGLYSLPVYYTSGGSVFTAYTSIIVTRANAVSVAVNETGLEELITDKGVVFALKVTSGDDLSVYWSDEEAGIVSTLSFTVTLSDGVEIIVPLGSEYIYYDRNVNVSDENWTVGADGERYALIEVPVTYNGAVTYLNLYLSDRKLESIEIIEVPAKLHYAEGQPLNLSGGYIVRRYSNGDSDVVPMTDGMLAVSGYEVNPFDSGNIIGSSYSQTVTVTYGGVRASFAVTTYKKLVPDVGGTDRISLSGTSDEYGESAEPVVMLGTPSIPGAEIPETDVEYYVDGSWSAQRPVYPGNYALKIIIFENEYYEYTEIEYGTFTIRPRTLFVEIIGMSKVYGSADPEFRYTVDDGVILPGDVVDIVLSREAGENVGKYSIVAGKAAGANDNILYELIVDPGELTITQRVVTTSPSGQPIDVDFTPPEGFAELTSTFVETGSRIGAFSAGFLDESGNPATIKSEDIEYYAYTNGNWVLLDNRPSTAGEYKVQISGNYSFRGSSSLTFRIRPATANG